MLLRCIENIANILYYHPLSYEIPMWLKSFNNKLEYGLNHTFGFTNFHFWNNKKKNLILSTNAVEQM